MRLQTAFATISALVCAFVFSAAAHAQEKKGTVVKLGGLSSTTPADWKYEKPANRLRAYQFCLPGKKSPKDDAELAILPNLTGDTDENIARWKAMFKTVGTKGPKVASKLMKTDRTIYLDVSGTFVNNHGRPGEKIVPKPGYRMFAVILRTNDGNSLIRLIGPQATLERHKKNFDAWLNGFGK